MDDDFRPGQKVAPWLFLSAGIGQIAVGAEVAKAAEQPVAAPDTLFLTMITVVPGVIFALGGVLQIVSNHFTKQKRIEVETRLKRLEMGIPCDDKLCLIQRAATKPTIPPIFTKSSVAAKPSDDTVDVP